MAFICTIEHDNYSGSVFKKGNSHASILPIGYDDADDKSYSLFVSLDPVVADEDSLELSFRVMEWDGGTDSEHAFWSGKDTSFIESNDRSAILRMLAAAVNRLLKSANPAKVVLCSRDGNAPDKANRKFILLGHVFEMCGYSVSTADTYLGMKCWWMER